MKQKYPELRKLIKNEYGTYIKFAEFLGIHRVSLQYKLMGVRPFNKDEIIKIKNVFNLTDEQVVRFFL